MSAIKGSKVFLSLLIAFCLAEIRGSLSQSFAKGIVYPKIKVKKVVYRKSKTSYAYFCL